MELLISTTIVLALMVQLSLAAGNSVQVVQPPNDKLYPIFEDIAKRMSEYQKKEIPIFLVIYTELLREHNEYLETHNTPSNQDYKAAIEKFLRSGELYELHPENCNLQRAAYVDLRAAHAAGPNDKDIRDMSSKAHNTKVYKNEYKNLIVGFNAQLPDLIKNFITSLNETEQQQQQYADLYNLGQEFLKATNQREQFKTFQDFIAKIKFTENTVSGNKENCKWDVTHFEKFMNHFKNRVFVDMRLLEL